MKRLYFIVVVGLLLGGAALFADESVLIDFTKLAADQALGTSKVPTENAATLIDFSNVAGATFTDEEKAAMKTSLALNNWEVVLASSARSVRNQSDTTTRESPISAKAKPLNGEEIANKKVLGVRVHFPVESFNSWAIVKPPFDIPAYADKTALQGDRLVVDAKDAGRGEKFNGYGVVKNVGVLKSIEATVYGSNFPNGFGLIVKDQDGNEQTIFMDYLEFDGWRKLVWNNPNYITEVRNREVRKYPLYPNAEPFLKLVGLIFYRDSMQQGGDIVSYVKDIRITYDKALLETQRDINDEAIWGILTARYEARKAAELKRLGNLQVLRTLEKQKMHKEEQN
jgi:hypothetical protein